MPSYDCTGRDARGNPLRERRAAESADALCDELTLRGWRELEITPAADDAPPRALSTEELITLGEEIAGMARAGLPLDKSLRAVSRDLRRGRLREVLDRLSDDLRAGMPLDEALRNQRGAVPPVFAALARAGMRSGRLPEVLVALNDYARTVAELRLLLFSALAYPLFVLVIGVGLLAASLSITTPGWKELFDSFDMEVPVATRVALELGSKPVQYFVVPLVGVLLLATAWWARSRRNPQSRGLGSRLLRGTPLFGVLLHCVRMASFSDLLALLVEHELPLPEAIGLAGGATFDPQLSRACKQAQAELTEGSTLTDAQKHQPAIPALFTWLVAVGERRGMLAASLRQLGETYRRRATVRASLARSVLPPLFVVIIGGGVVGFYIAVLLRPLYSFMSLWGGGGGSFF